MLSALFDALLAAFDRVVFPTFRLCYTQFVPFYTTSLDTAFPDAFLGKLLAKILAAEETGGTAEMMDGQSEVALDASFPFDPMQLPRCKAFVGGELYQTRGSGSD